jgi:hypothetical protein
MERENDVDEILRVRVTCPISSLLSLGTEAGIRGTPLPGMGMRLR